MVIEVVSVQRQSKRQGGRG